MSTPQPQGLPPLPKANSVRTITNESFEYFTSVEPVAYMTEDGRVSMRTTVETAMPRAVRESFTIPLYAGAPPSQASVEPTAWLHTAGHMQSRNPKWEPEIAEAYSVKNGWTPLYTTIPPTNIPADVEAPKTEFVLRELMSALNGMLTFFGMDEDDASKPTFDKARKAYDFARIVTRPLEPYEQEALSSIRGTLRSWHEAAVAKGFGGVEDLLEAALYRGTRELSLVSAPQPQAVAASSPATAVDADRVLNLADRYRCAQAGRDAQQARTLLEAALQASRQPQAQHGGGESTATKLAKRTCEANADAARFTIALQTLRASLDPDDWMGPVTMHAYIDKVLAGGSPLNPDCTLITKERK